MKLTNEQLRKLRFEKRTIEGKLQQAKDENNNDSIKAWVMAKNEFGRTLRILDMSYDNL